MYIMETFDRRANTSDWGIYYAGVLLMTGDKLELEEFLSDIKEVKPLEVGA